MKKKMILNNFFFTIAFCSLFKFNFLLGSGITYSFDLSGRLGDAFIVYCKSKYLSLATNLTFYYKPFYCSDKFNMHLQEVGYDSRISVQRVQRISSGDEIQKNLNKEILYVSDLFTVLEGKKPDDIGKVIPNPLWSFFWVDEIYKKMHKNSEHASIIKNMLQPIKKINVNLPKDRITVAVHIRKSSGNDWALSSIQIYDRESLNKNLSINKQSFDYVFPLKFPPEQYYIDQIRMLSMLFQDCPLYVQIFTDDKKPLDLLNRIKYQVNRDNIEFEFIGNDDVIHDLYQMSQFDCLIKSCSHFAGVAQLMGNHKIIISPKNYQWIGSALVITEVGLFLYNSNIKHVQVEVLNMANLEVLKVKIKELF